jgi:formylglycine-generating enzyme required for sulfatase activity
MSGCSVSKKNPTKGNPPGTLKINDTLFIDQTEVANIYWREYLYYLTDTKKEEQEYEKALPDTLVWNSDTSVNPLSQYYFRHPSFNNYPVVGISYQQAIEFCKWRTFVVNLGKYLDENKFTDFKEHLNDPFPVKLYYRLPAKEEWEMIAAGKLPIQEFPYGYKDVYTNWRGKRSKMFNCIFWGDTLNKNRSEKFYTADVKAFFPNGYGAYNMIGNVAEMISEKGLAKGGSFVHPLDSCKISINQNYSKPEMWLGFRCVAVRIK